MKRKLPIFVLVAVFSAAALTTANAQTIAPVAPKAPNERRIERVVTADLFGVGGSSYLGIEVIEVTKENFASYGLREVRGAAVEKVSENSPAQAAGLEKGDVVVKFNGADVTSVRQLVRLIAEVAPDHKANLIVVRGGGEREITATLGKRDAAQFRNGARFGSSEMPGMPDFRELPQIPLPPVAPLLPDGENGGDGNVFIWRTGESRQIGIGATALTKQLADYFGIDGDKGGVLIDNVRENSPAAKAGLKAGDVIVEIEGQEVKRISDVTRRINQKKEGDVALTIVRERNRQTVRVTPETIKNNFNRQYFQNPENLESLGAPTRKLGAIIPASDAAKR